MHGVDPLKREAQQRATIPTATAAEDIADVPTTTRRAFLGRTGTKAAFIVPAVWTLTAQQAMAAGSNASANPSCLEAAEPCILDADCCSNMCMVGMCVG